MPFVNVSWNVKTTKEKKRTLMDDITSIISETTDTGKERIYVFIRDYDEENVSNVDCPVVQIDWVDIPNRTPEAKAEIIKQIQTKLAEFPNVNPARTLVLFSDIPRYNAKIGL